MDGFSVASVAAAVSIVVAAGLMRGRMFAMFGAVILSIHTLTSIALAPAFAWCWPLLLRVHDLRPAPTT